MQSCELCDVGTYIDTYSGTSCITCPQGRSTQGFQQPRHLLTGSGQLRIGFAGRIEGEALIIIQLAQQRIDRLSQFLVVPLRSEATISTVS